MRQFKRVCGIDDDRAITPEGMREEKALYALH